MIRNIMAALFFWPSLLYEYIRRKKWEAICLPMIFMLAIIQMVWLIIIFISVSYFVEMLLMLTR